MASTDAWVAWLVDKLNAPTVEDPVGSNHTPIGVEYGFDRVAWCCEFQSLAALHTFGRKVLWTAGVADARARAQRGENGMSWIARDDTIRVGDLPCYDWGGHGNPGDMHIEGVVNPGTQSRFETIGGNVHDRVARQWRDRSSVMGFIRLPFDQIGLGAPQEDDLSAQTEQNVQEIYNALFDGSATKPGPNGIQARLARLEADSKTFHDTSNGFFAALVRELGNSKDGTGLVQSVVVVRRLVKAVLRRQFNLNDDDIHKIETTAT